MNCSGLGLAVLLTAFVGSAFAAPAEAPRSPTPPSVEAPLRVTTVAKGLEHPWALAFLPDGRLLVTERAGRLRLVTASGEISAPLGGLPEVRARGQGGLLDVALSPKFAKDQLVYLSFSEPGEDGAGTAVARGRFTESALVDTQVIWRQTPKTPGNNHFGSRLVFAGDGTLFVTTGDRYDQRPKVQDLSSTIGKVVRINADGTTPKNNPFARRAGARPEIWSYGHRNIQAAALQPNTDRLWTIEHGARGGDELNQAQRGKNYGWPVIAYGTDYSGEKIGEGTAKSGMEQPVYWWDPVIAPSGAVFYTGALFPDWHGDLFVGSLNPGALVRLEINDGKVVGEERYLADRGYRVRDVAQDAAGALWLVTDAGNGQVLKLEPAAR